MVNTHNRSYTHYWTLVIKRLKQMNTKKKITIRTCPICHKRLAKGNPNKYCFAHIVPYAARDLDLQYKKDQENMRKNTYLYFKRRKIHKVKK
jgi:hypothetical protein